MSCFLLQKGYHEEDVTPRILEKEMKKLMDLADKSCATRILDYETKIQHIFQRVEETTTSFFVGLCSSLVIYIHIAHS